MKQDKRLPAGPEPIAIIGMACIFPQAPDLRTFWNNILSGVDAVGEPIDNWDARRYLDSGRIYTQFGGYLKELYRFDPREFGIMPNSMNGGEPDQLLALRVARDALADAGYLGPDVDHTDTGVVIGHSTYLHRGQGTIVQNNIVIDQMLDLVKAAMPGIAAPQIDEMRQLLAKKLPPMNADTAPGLVPNVMTGRIANRLNLRGPNYLVDAACSSSLLAVSAAIDELRAGRSRMMLCGGVNASLPADVNTIFTQLGALSRRGRVRPFEAGSDGTLLGEGLGLVVLKRQSDALADGDRIYAVIRGVAQSSDGRGAGLLAPSHDGETLAMQRAYSASGVDPASIGLVEAHGTGIPLGDQTEIASLKSVFGERTTPIGIKALGSVKSMISHTIPAAGVASLIKMTLALHHRVLPPTLCETVNPALGVDKTPFYINTETAPWISTLERPRRAGVNAFGFGGTNTHAIVEQAPPEAVRPGTLSDWPAELCVLAADSAEGLVAKLERLVAGISRNPQWRVAEVAAALAGEAVDGSHRVAIVAKNMAGLSNSLAQAIKRVQGGSAALAMPKQSRGGLSYGNRRVAGKLAYLFPGEGSQYPAMYADLAQCFGVIQSWLDFWHGLYDLPVGHTRTDIVFPTCEIGPERRRQHEQMMHGMDVGSESVFIGGVAMHELLTSLGVEADAMLGHSSGESAALCASGANPASTAQERAFCISQHFAVYEEMLKAGKIPTGALLAVGALPPDTVQGAIAGRSDVVVAMDNCSNQIVLYGSPEGIAGVQAVLIELGGICLPLPFDRGYHTAAFQDVSNAFLGYYKQIKIGRPRVPIYSCATTGLFPSEPAAVRKLAAAQWSQKVRFRETVQKMHDDGVRLFVEVGPSANLTAFVNDILIDREYVALPTNLRRKNGVEQLLSVLGQLYSAGRWQVLDRLFGARAIAAIDIDGSPPLPHGVLLDNTMPMVRLSEAEREQVRLLACPPVDFPAAAQAMRRTVPSAAEVDPQPPLPDGRERVMADYFELMRGFLDRQRDVVERMPLDVASMPQSPMPAAERALPSTHAVEGPTPLLDEIVERDEQHLLARCSVSLRNDHFIRHHTISAAVSSVDPELFGLSCVPFAVSLEVMAEACALLAGRVDVKLIENVEAYDWIALDEGALTFEVRAEVVDRERGHYRARVISARGPVLMADFRFEAEWVLPAVPELLERRASCLNHPNMYATGMFHGPVFQSMYDPLAWDDTGIDLELTDVTLRDFFAEGHVPQMVLNPVLLDAMGQVVACWYLQYIGTEFHAFPSTLARIELYETCPTDRRGIVARMRQRPVDGRSTELGTPRAWDFECIDGDGQVLMRGSNLVNLFFRVPRAYHDVRIDPLNGWMGQPLDALPGIDAALWELPMMSEEFCAQSGAICLRVMAHAMLSPPERVEWGALQGKLRRRREWLFGRSAVKEIVRHWLFEQTGELLYPTDIVVRSDEHGALHVDGWWRDRLAPAPSVSLTHNANSCVAALAAPGQSVGVDLEEFGRLRQPEHMTDALADSERDLVRGLHGASLEERLLRIWCAKEAAAKCLGIGFQGKPRSFVVHSTDDTFENMVIHHDHGGVDVQVLQHGNAIIAAALMVPSELEVHG